MAIRYMDMFAGIGGFRSGLEKIGGFDCVAYCEIDEKARKAYEALYDTKGEICFEDATKINPNDVPDVDLICGGFPCQSFSIAGKRKGFDDTRGTLFFEIARIAAVKKPAVLFLENVQGLLSHDKGWTFQTILKALDELGYDVFWQVCNSANFGVPQSRKRVFIIGYHREKCTGKVWTFNETNPQTLIRRVPGSEGNRVYDAKGLGITLTAGGGGSGGKCGLYVVPLPVKSKTKLGYQFAFPNDSIDISYMTLNSRRGRVGPEIAHTLTTNSTQAYYFVDLNPNPKLTEIARCITTRHNSGVSKHKGEHSAVMVIVKELSEEEILAIRDEQNNHWFFDNDDNQKLTALIMSDGEGHIFIGYIRRLMPIECWRLQGFTDEQFNTVQSLGICDGDLYKMAGNAVSVPVIAAVGEIIKKIIEGEE